ncbi:uridine monophosphate kinase [bacterium]|jgi:uridylate kinase|nr:uridine monophosphate kinase [bacterium]
MYKRILLKLSGELFAGESGVFDYEKIEDLAHEIHKFTKQNSLSLAVVVGAGNLWRYRDNSHLSLSRVLSDQLGMLSTNYNAILLSVALKSVGAKSTVYSAFGNSKMIRDYEPKVAKVALDDNHIVVLAGGTGNPYCTTDLASVLRALELECQVVFKATNVDGVYDKDPNQYSDAKRFATLSFTKALELDLKVMDRSAFGMAMENDLPLLVFDFSKSNSLQNVYENHSIATLVS